MRLSRSQGFILGIYLLSPVLLCAQVRDITRTEFQSIEHESVVLLGKVAHRAKTTYLPVPTRGSEEEILLSQISEHVPPESTRTVSVWKTKAGTRKLESIGIGSRKWTRENDGRWKIERQQEDRFTVIGDLADTRITDSYRHLGTTRLGTFDVDVYESTVRREYPRYLLVTTTVRRIWVDKKGRLVKYESKDTDKDKDVTSHYISEYEYDTAIKIRRPIK